MLLLLLLLQLHLLHVIVVNLLGLERFGLVFDLVEREEGSGSGSSCSRFSSTVVQVTLVAQFERQDATGSCWVEDRRMTSIVRSYGTALLIDAVAARTPLAVG